jgi:hypothetical protein
MVLFHAQMQVLPFTTLEVERVEAAAVTQRRCKQLGKCLAVDWFRVLNLPTQGVG